MNIIGFYDGVLSCRKCGLHDEPAEHVTFDYNGLEQERIATLGKVAKHHILPDMEHSGIFW